MTGPHTHAGTPLHSLRLAFSAWIAPSAVPRQRKFQADLAVINQCLNELIETVRARGARSEVLACPPASWDASWLFGSGGTEQHGLCHTAGLRPVVQCASPPAASPRARWRRVGNSACRRRSSVKPHPQQSFAFMPTLLPVTCLQAKATRQEEDLEALQARDYSKVCAS